MRFHQCLTTLGVLWLAACAPADDSRQTPRDAAATAESAVRFELLISADWLARNLDDPGVVILHVAPNRSAYDEGHIPGARFLPLGAILAERDGNINELPPVEHLDSVFESVGVSDDTRVILYGPPLAAARTFFTLDYLGHGDRTALLDGGLEVWKAEGREVTTEPMRPTKGNFNPRPRPELVVDAAWVAQHLDNDDVALIDARPEAQYTGAEAGGDVVRPGHIPGARNLFWEQLIQSPSHPTLQDPATLYALFRDAGAEPGDTVVTYCRTGVQASFAYFVARYLGFETRLYDGSFIDWSRRGDLPVAR